MYPFHIQYRGNIVSLPYTLEIRVRLSRFTTIGVNQTIIFFIF